MCDLYIQAQQIADIATKAAKAAESAASRYCNAKPYLCLSELQY